MISPNVEVTWDVGRPWRVFPKADKGREEPVWGRGACHTRDARGTGNAGFKYQPQIESWELWELFLTLRVAYWKAYSSWNLNKSFLDLTMGKESLHKWQSQETI